MSKRFGLCHNCKRAGCNVPAKYRCPACSTVSCSLACVTAHKLADSCSGVRNRATKVRKRNYDEANLMSDYTLLEDAGRAIDAAERVRGATANGISKGRMALLTREAARRGVTLRFMPRGFARHTRNSSHLRSDKMEKTDIATKVDKDNKMDKTGKTGAVPGGKTLFWHLDVVFVAPDGGHRLVKVESCSEQQKVANVLSGAVAALGKRKRRRISEVRDMSEGAKSGNSGTTSSMDYFRKFYEAEAADLDVFLRNEHIIPAAQVGAPNGPSPHTRGRVQHTGALPATNASVDLRRFLPIKQDVSILDALRGRAIVEFPVLYVAAHGSPEAAELSEATSGLFEQPEAEGSSSSSDSESDSESDSDDVPSPVAHSIITQCAKTAVDVGIETGHGMNGFDVAASSSPKVKLSQSTEVANLPIKSATESDLRVTRVQSPSTPEQRGKTPLVAVNCSGGSGTGLVPKG